MKPTEREELARLLPSPGDPVLSSDRLDLMKDHMMRELTRDATEGATTRRPARARRFALLAVPVATAVVVAATVVLGAGGGGETGGERADGGNGGTGGTGSRAPATDPRAVDLLDRIATVAAAGKTVPVRDDQYVYTHTQGAIDIDDQDMRIHEKYRFSTWASVDGRRKGLSRMTGLTGLTEPENVFEGGTRNRNRDVVTAPNPDVPSFREVEALPTDPDKLLAKLRADTSGGVADDRTPLELISIMLDEATLLPDVAAALYRATAKIPGVSVVANAKDFAGRPGIGLTFEEHRERRVWVFDRKSLDYLGSGKEALLDVAVVDKAGETPKN